MKFTFQWFLSLILGVATIDDRMVRMPYARPAQVGDFIHMP